MKLKILIIVGIFILLCASWSCTMPKTQTTSTVKVTETTKVTDTRTQTTTTKTTATDTTTVTVTVTTTLIPIRVKTNTYGDGSVVALDMESEYLPIVVAGMVSEASEESLKAQAIVARSYAFYKMAYEPMGGSEYHMVDADSIQMYNPTEWYALTPERQDMVRQAISDTKGLVLKYAGVLVDSVYVRGDSKTDQWITLNEGKSGNAITQSTLIAYSAPPSGTPHNRGCMGLKQSKDLSKAGYTYVQILQYFYGADIIIEKHNIYT